MTWKGLLLRILAIPPVAAFDVWLGTNVLRWLGVMP